MMPLRFPCRRRLLFLLPFPPRSDATHGGSRAMAQMLKRLAARHHVALLCLRAPGDPPIDETLQEQCELVEEVRRPAPGVLFEQGLSRLNSLLHGRPLWATGAAVEDFRARVGALARDWRPDIVQIEYHIMGQYLSALEACPAPRVLTEHEPGTIAARDLFRSHTGFAQAMYWLDLLAWRRFEPGIINQVQAVVVFTERDRQAVAQFGRPTQIVRIPLGIPFPERPLDPVGGRPLNLLFVGNFIHPPNADGAVRLISAIFPRVQASIPEAILYIVGNQPTAGILGTLAKNVIVTGRVADVTPYLDHASLVVAPLRLGGGMRVKVLEALAAGKAVIASPLAVEGLALVDGEHFILAESDQEFSDAIAQLLTDPERRASLAARARAWACTNLDWEKSISAYEALYQSLIDRSCTAHQF